MKTPKSDIHEAFVDQIMPIMASLHRFCRALTNNRDAAKDLASDAVLVAFERYEKIKEKQAIRSYLFTTASRLARDERNKAKRHEPMTDVHAETLHDTSSSAEIHAYIFHLQEAMRTLPEAMREAIMLF